MPPRRPFPPARGVLAVAAAALLAGTPASAQVVLGVAPPGSRVEPAAAARAFLAFEGGVERLVLEPSFASDARGVALVLAVPARPRIVAAPERLFDELDAFAGAPPAGREPAPAADYEVTVLPAESTDLAAWLEGRGYAVLPAARALALRTARRPGHCFVVMQVDLAGVADAVPGVVHARLRPVELSFAAAAPMLPTFDGRALDVTLTALSDRPLALPGAGAPAARQLGSAEIERVHTLLRYRPWEKWLARTEARVVGEPGGDVLLATGEPLEDDAW